jgi:hypothetical protein
MSFNALRVIMLTRSVSKHDAKRLEAALCTSRAMADWPALKAHVRQVE